MQAASSNPYAHTLQNLTVGDQTYQYYSLKALNDPRIEKLPYSVRVLLECAIRKCDEFNFKKTDVEKILNWSVTSKQDVEIPFKPSRVILQDLTGVPCVVDLATMRDAMVQLGSDPQRINPECPVDLVIDHSIQVDFSRTQDSKDKNEALEFERNQERFSFLKWGQKSFTNFSAFPPGSGIVHQVNLEFIAHVVFNNKGLLYPDSLVGTDSHTTMINGLGVVGWGVGGIEAESVMMGQTISMVLPEVVGFKLVGELPKTVTATDLVLTCTDMLRKRKVVGKFVEFFGPGVNSLSLADRATISNMAPEYGATIGYFPVDSKAVDYLHQTGRCPQKIAIIEKYLEAQGLLRNYQTQADPEFSGEVLHLDLSTVVPSMAGPKRPHDRVAVADLKNEFTNGLTAPLNFRAYALTQEKAKDVSKFNYKGQEYTLKHGAVVLCAITSCTNTSNPGVMLAAGMLARNAVEKGLKVAPYIKTSLSPGSGVVSMYFEAANLQKYFDALGFNTAGYGCMTCIGNSGELDKEVGDAITSGDLVVASVLSGNRNFEGRVHPLVRANYLASPPLVVAYALAGTVVFDFETEPLGTGKDGKPVYLRDIWPARNEVEWVEKCALRPEMFKSNYEKIQKGTDRWNSLTVPEGIIYKWPQSTYIHKAPFFNGMTKDLPKINDIVDGHVFAIFGDSITTDHISPAGNIAKNSPAGRYLVEKTIQIKDFNTYGSRRGHDEVMARGTFANIRIINKMNGGKVGPQTIHVPSGETMDFFDAAERYQKEGHPLVILAGNEYGCGSSRDWAAKGPFLQGVKAVIAQSFERIHRSNLVGMGILPLEFKNGENAESLGLTGKEQLTIHLNEGKLKINQDLEVSCKCGKKFVTKVRLDTDPEIAYFVNGGILNYVLRKIAAEK